uniref:Exonuclease 1 n=1 Tax=Anopheles dirus TaxID=7168 RepID=A0A182NGF0_9DIPT
MGITGLLPFLEKASSACHLRELRGKCVAIDTYCWLHRGAFGCAERLARGEPTDFHIQYCLKYVQLLLSYNIKPILVFDGQHLPAKAATEAKRRENRENARRRGAELLREGRIDEARSFLRRCVDITHEMAHQLIQACRARDVDCVVAPYEADAQLAYLNRADIAQYVITEDSDLVLFGCTRVLFKLDLTGAGRLVEASKLHLAMGCREDRYQFAKFRYMCILSGCDYLDSLPGIGLGKACRFIKSTEDPDIRRALAKMPAYLNMRQLAVTEEYKDEFLKADATFKHMVVYDPVHRRQTRLEDPDAEGTPEQYCCNAGTFQDEKTAFELAVGNLDPFSMRRMGDWHPDQCEHEGTAGKRRHPSIWRTNYRALREENLSKGTQSQASLSQKSSLSSFVKRPPPNVDFAEQGTKETIGDVLRVYGIQHDEPPLKRLCHVQTANASKMSTVAFEYEDLGALEALAQLDQPTTPKRHRNPFVVASSGPGKGQDTPNGMFSPTKITPENRSLLHNVSPVKRIDYSQQRTQITSPTTVSASTSTTNRLDRFKPAAKNKESGNAGSGEKQKVISRFFCTQAAGARISQTKTANGTSSPKAAGSADVLAAIVSPTAIVKEIKRKREAQFLKAAAIYLTSPEASVQNRGERTPEKRRPVVKTSPGSENQDDGTFGRLDSGIAMMADEADLKVEQPVEEDSEGSALSCSQKENDDAVLNSGVKSTTVRLALFERQPPKRTGVGQSSDREHTADEQEEELAIVLDDGDSNDGVKEVQVATTMKHKTEVQKGANSPPSVTLKPGGGAGTGTGNTKSKARSTCKRPGLSAKGKPAAKADNGGGLTQSPFLGLAAGFARFQSSSESESESFFFFLPPPALPPLAPFCGL